MITLSFDTWEEYDASVSGIASLVIALGTDNAVSEHTLQENHQPPEEAE
jgi:hypothetical protein